MRIRKNLARSVAACSLLALVLAMAKPARAGGVGADTIALFPKETGEFGYVDLKTARTMKWFPALQEQVLPERFRQFEKFLASAGVDPNSQVDELVWGLVPDVMKKNDKGASTEIPSSEQTVGIAMGNFNPESTEAYFKQQKLPTTKIDSYTLFAFGSGAGAADLYFFFLDSSKAVFGHKPLLEKLLEIRLGRLDGLLRNEQMYNLINEAERFRSGLGGAGSGLYTAGDGSACSGSATVPGSGGVDSEDAGHDDHGHGQQRGGLQSSRRFAAPQGTPTRSANWLPPACSTRNIKPARTIRNWANSSTKPA